MALQLYIELNITWGKHRKEKASEKSASASSVAQRTNLYCGTAEFLEACAMLIKFKGKGFGIRQVVLMLSSYTQIHLLLKVSIYELITIFKGTLFSTLSDQYL